MPDKEKNQGVEAEETTVDLSTLDSELAPSDHLTQILKGEAEELSTEEPSDKKQLEEPVIPIAKLREVLKSKGIKERFVDEQDVEALVTGLVDQYSKHRANASRNAQEVGNYQRMLQGVFQQLQAQGSTKPESVASDEDDLDKFTVNPREFIRQMMQEELKQQNQYQGVQQTQAQMIAEINAGIDEYVSENPDIQIGGANRMAIEQAIAPMQQRGELITRQVIEQIHSHLQTRNNGGNPMTPNNNDAIGMLANIIGQAQKAGATEEAAKRGAFAEGGHGSNSPNKQTAGTTPAQFKNMSSTDMRAFLEKQGIDLP